MGDHASEFPVQLKDDCAQILALLIDTGMMFLQLHYDVASPSDNDGIDCGLESFQNADIDMDDIYLNVVVGAARGAVYGVRDIANSSKCSWESCHTSCGLYLSQTQ